jgi:phosphoribosylaminoimidazolecarboxamide formyltransferase/IMP cyclohydrolase
MKKALISLSDKRNLLEFAGELIKLGYEIISTGGTLKTLQDNFINATAVADVTSFPEIMNGRVKTLHPKIMGGILGVPNNDLHVKQATDNGIQFIDLVVVNLYPFEKTVHNPLANWHDIIENIDIGGPSLIRGAAKNYQYVNIITDPNDYELVLNQLKENGKTSMESRMYLAQKAFAHTSAYDALIAQTFNNNQKTPNPAYLNVGLPLKQELRYGENPHQTAFFYESEYDNLIDVIHGKQLSYNNYLDIDAALRLIIKFEEPAVAIFKHTNPCGVATGNDLSEAYNNAFATDTVSPFGGIVIVNKELDLQAAELINQIFTEIIIAPAFSPNALEKLKKKKDRRLIIFQLDDIKTLKNHLNIVTCLKGYLCQSADIDTLNRDEWIFATNNRPDEKHLHSLEFAWNVVSMLKSNAICLVKGTQTIGIGIGQTSRVDSLKIALNRAKEMGFDLNGAVCASDGFFPFRDSIDLLHENGIMSVIQPGGSRADDEVIDACNELKMSMIITNRRHFRH